MKAIFKADDFGVSVGTNKAIEAAYFKGILTSASVRSNGSAFRDAIQRARKMGKLGLGVHLNITDGVAHTEKLANKQGYYKYNFLDYFIRLNLGGYQLIKDIERDFEYQINLVKKTGLDIDHFDGQDHIHMIPSIFKIVCKLCSKYKIESIRLCDEPYIIPWDNLIKITINGGILKATILDIFANINKSTLKKYKLRTTDAFFGVLNTNNMTKQVVFNILKRCVYEAKYDSVEIALHPAYPNDTEDKVYTSPFFAKYSNLPNRKIELETLLSKKINKFVQRNNISLIRFSDL